MTPMQRTIKEMKERGRKCGIVERFIHNRHVGRGIRSDLFGLFDLVAMAPKEGIIGIQVCGRDFAPHYRKITEDLAETAIMWMNSGGHIEIWSWRLLLIKRGGKKKKYQPRVHKIIYEDFKCKYIPKGIDPWKLEQ